MLAQAEAARIAAEQAARYEIVEQNVPRGAASSFQVFEVYEDKEYKVFRGEFRSLQAAENYINGR